MGANPGLCWRRQQKTGRPFLFLKITAGQSFLVMHCLLILVVDLQG